MSSEGNTVPASPVCPVEGYRTGRWLVKLGLAACLGLGLVGCGGGGGDSLADQAVSAVLNFLSGGSFKDLDSLVVALEGDNLVVKDFGNSELGTNPGILPVGSALVSGIACGSTSCTGQVLVPTFSNGTLTSYTRETGTVTQEDVDSFRISSPTLGAKTFTRTTATPAPVPTPGATATLAKDATCAEWWAALKGHSWRWVSVGPGEQMPNGTLSFTEEVSNGTTTMRWAIDADPMPRADTTDYYDWYPSRSGQVGLTDDFPTLGLCRISLFFDPNKFLGLGNWTGFDEYVGFVYSLSGGRLEFTSPDNGAVKGWVFQVAN